MKISKVSATNFHGLNFSKELGGVNVIIGQNFGGKTAIAKAIRLGLTGKLPPPIGTRGIYQLAGNTHEAGEMAIHIETDNGREVDLAWRKSDRGTVTQTGSVPDDLVFPDMLCDVRQFFGLTSEKRINTIFAACDISALGFGADTIKQRLAEISVMPRVTCEAQITLIHDKIDAEFELHPIQEAAVIVVAWMKETAAQAKKSDTDISGQMSGLRLKMGQETPKDQSAAIAEIQGKLGQSEMNSGLNAQRKQIAVESAQKVLERLGVVGILSESFESFLADSELQETASKQKVETLSKVVLADLTKLQAEAESLEKEMGETEADIAGLRAEIDAENKLAKSVEKLELCETCKTSLAEARAKKIAKAQAKIETATKQYSRLQKASVKALDTLNKARLAKDEHEQAVINVGYEVAELLKKRVAVELAYKSYLAAKKDFDACPKVVDTTELRQQLTELQGKQSLYTTYKNNQKRMDELEAELIVVRCKAEVFAKAVKMVLEEQAKVMDAAFNQVLTVARNFTDGLLNSPIEFYKGELGRRVSEIDRQFGNTAPVGGWISHETWSDSEMLLAYAGFSVALCKDAPIKLVVMDELNCCHSSKRKALLERMVKLEKEGVIDQFLGIAPEVTEEVAGVNYIQL